MIWGDASSKEGTQFDRQALPSGYRDPTHQGLMGVGLSLPEVKYVEDTGGAARQAPAATSGEPAWQRDIAPGHRQVIREYFKP